jgi:hypothetical protein
MENLKNIHLVYGRFVTEFFFENHNVFFEYS